MLYSLLSPAETKEAGGNLPPVNPKSFIFPTLYEKRLELLNKFENYKKTLSEKELLEFFELKTLDERSEYRDNVF
ncbi:MAG TPA: peroxide stress protein YaaA, partial [Campylobacterales bacterium]|nr:peroxide stress protein YaaA [Campylobacterales bacterium]